jgi:hypothetical protein
LWGIAALVLLLGVGPASPGPVGGPGTAPGADTAARSADGQVTGPGSGSGDGADLGSGDVDRRVTPVALPVAPAERAPRVLFVGDSLAAQLGHHASVALHETGVDSRVAAAWGIGLFTRAQYDMGALQPDPPDSSLLGMASAAIAEFDPDVVAVYSNHNFWPPHPRDASGREVTWDSPAFPGMVRTLLTDLVRRLSAGGARVYLVAPIPLFPPDDQPEQTRIWDAYMAAREELGVEVITPGDFMARPDGERHDELPDCTGRPRRVRPDEDVHLTYFGAGLLGGRTAAVVAGLLPRPPSTRTATRPTGPAEAPVALVADRTGYRLVTCDGATFHYGRHATALGSAADGQGRPLDDPVVAATALGGDPGRGALLLTRAGLVLRLDRAAPGTAPGPAATVARVALQPGRLPVGIAAAGPGDGFWVATADGRVDAFAGAPALGGPDPAAGGDGAGVVALAATPDGGGYYLLTASGRVLGFGDAPVYGDLAGRPPATPPVGLAVHPGGGGYWVLEQGGTVHAFGAAGDHGSAAAVDMWHQTFDRHTAGLPPLRLPAAEAPPVEAVALLPTATGRGYWLALASGAVCHFGDAPTLGSIHRSAVDPLMTYVGEPYYVDGPCTHPPADRLMALRRLYADIHSVVTAAPPPPTGG